MMGFQDGLYSIKSKHAGRVLDMCQDVDRRGMAILYDDYKQPNQQFFLKPSGVEVQIVSKQTGKTLTVAANSPNNGAPVFEEPAQGMEGQRFRLQEVSPGSNEYIIYTFCGKVLDCCEGKKSNGTKVIQWEFNGGENQKWLLKRL